MSKLIVDTSVIIKWLSQNNENFLEQANLILHHVQEGKVDIFSPELVKYEVGNVLLKQAK